MKKILYLTYDGLTDPLGQSQVLPYLEGLALKGHSITILSAEKLLAFHNLHDHISTKTKSAGIGWEWIKYSKRPAILATVYDIYRLKRKAIKIYQKEAFQIVHCRSYITAFVGLFLKRRYGVKFIFDMRGFYADERVDGGLWNLQKPIFNFVYKYFKRKEKEFLKEADHIISLTEAGKNIILNWEIYPAVKDRISIIPCCADEHLFSLSEVDVVLLQNLKSEYQIFDEDLVLSYLGSIGTWYMLPEMLDFFKCLKIKQPNAKFLFITREKPNLILTLCQEKEIDHESIIITKADREQVPTYLSLSKISIFFIKPVFSKKASSPTKFGEILNLGIPVICNRGVGDVDFIVDNENVGFAVREFSIAEYTEIVEKLDQLLDLDKNELKEIADKYFSLKKGIDNYHHIYQQL